jgi:hypothetical protein
VAILKICKKLRINTDQTIFDLLTYCLMSKDALVWQGHLLLMTFTILPISEFVGPYPV